MLTLPNLSSEEDWSIISSSDMDDQSTTSSIRGDFDDGLTTPTYDSNDDDSNDDDSNDDDSNDDDSNDGSDDDHIESTIEFSKPIDLDQSTTIPSATTNNESSNAESKVESKVKSNKAKQNYIPNIFVLFISMFFSCHKKLKEISINNYNKYLKNYLKGLKEGIETPTLRYRVKNWNSFTDSNLSNNSSKKLIQNQFKVQKEDLYFHDRIVYEIILFLENNNEILIYYFLMSIISPIFMFITYNYLPIVTGVFQSSPPEPQSYTDKLNNFYNQIIYESPSSISNEKSFFSYFNSIGGESINSKLKTLRLTKYWNFVKVNNEKFTSSFDKWYKFSKIQSSNLLSDSKKISNVLIKNFKFYSHDLADYSSNLFSNLKNHSLLAYRISKQHTLDLWSISNNKSDKFLKHSGEHILNLFDISKNYSMKLTRNGLKTSSSMIQFGKRATGKLIHKFDNASINVYNYSKITLIPFAKNSKSNFDKLSVSIYRKMRIYLDNSDKSISIYRRG